jgi:uncharacterized protein
MTPQEQQLVADLFDRLATLEGRPRDPDAERLIREGLQKAPNAVYALVQSVLVQDEALKRANARIEELERAASGAPASPAPQSGSFLDSMRNMISPREPSRGSVPSVRPGGQGSSGVWGARPEAAPEPPGPPPGYAPEYRPSAPGGMAMGPGPGFGGTTGPGLGGGSFLGTAAAAAAGMVGGSMLLNGIRSMMGGREGFGDYGRMMPSHAMSPSDSSPGDSSHGSASSDLSREAGTGDIGGQHDAAYQEPDQDNPSGDDDQASDDYDAAGDYGNDDDQTDDYDGGDDTDYA